MGKFLAVMALVVVALGLTLFLPITVEMLGKEPIKYEKMDENKMRQVFKRHVMEGEIQTAFVLAKGAEVVR